MDGTAPPPTRSQCFPEHLLGGGAGARNCCHTANPTPQLACQLSYRRGALGDSKTTACDTTAAPAAPCTRFFPEHRTVGLRERGIGGWLRQTRATRPLHPLPPTSSPNNSKLPRGRRQPLHHHRATRLPPEPANTMPHPCDPLFWLMHFSLKLCLVPVAPMFWRVNCSLKLCCTQVPYRTSPAKTVSHPRVSGA